MHGELRDLAKQRQLKGETLAENSAKGKALDIVGRITKPKRSEERIGIGRI